MNSRLIACAATHDMGFDAEVDSIARDASRVLIAAAALGCTVLLGACTEMRWEKEGFALDLNNEDWNECRREAYMSAARQSFYFNPFPRAYIGRDARGRAVAVYRYWPNSDRFMLEQDYLNSCMRRRGYRLVPVEPETRSPPP